jgi:hypothetical protein
MSSRKDTKKTLEGILTFLTNNIDSYLINGQNIMVMKRALPKVIAPIYIVGNNTKNKETGRGSDSINH